MLTTGLNRLAKRGARRLKVGYGGGGARWGPDRQDVQTVESVHQ
jgi:hypothetical protein